jgi:hypothetical protein
MMIGAIVYLLSTVSSSSFGIDSFIGIFIGCMGYIFFISLSKDNPHLSLVHEIIFEKDTESITFQTGSGNLSNSTTLKFGDLKKIILEKVHNKNSNHSRIDSWWYYINLQKYDGSIFELDLFTNENSLQTHVNKLLKVLSLEIEDKTGIGISNQSPKTYSSKSDSDFNYQPTRFVEVKESNSKTNLALKKPPLPPIFYKIFIPIIILFLGTPIWIIVSVFLSDFGGFIVFILPFCLLFIGIFLLIVTKQLEKYSVSIDSFNLNVEYSYPSFLNSIFHRQITVPVGSIKFIQVHRLLSGTYTLSIELNSETVLKEMGFLIYFYNFGTEGINSNFENKNKVLNLWQIPISQGEDNPQFLDLYYLEKLIEEKINLKER